MSRFGSCLSKLKTCNTSAVPRWRGRRLHTVTPLSYSIEEGCGEFLPPQALKVVGVDYQRGLLDRLNEEVKGTDMENMSVIQTIISAAPDRSKVLAFNYASLALNNHFFLEQLKPPRNTPDHQHAISMTLESEIRTQHGSLAQLKSAFSAAAMGLFTNGWVWFVTDVNGNTAVIPTFGPGSLLMRSQSYIAHSKALEMGPGMLQFSRGDPLSADDPYAKEYHDELTRRKEDGDLLSRSNTTTTSPSSPSPQPISRDPPPGTTPSSPASGVPGSSSTSPSNPPHSRSLHSSPRRLDDLTETFAQAPSMLYSEPDQPLRPRSNNRTEVLTMGETLFPLFCVSVNEHAWMSAGYGVWGKEEWLKKFWTVLDWEKVSKAYDHYRVKEASR